MKFEELGRLVATRAVVELQERNTQFASFVRIALDRYMNGDWGEMAEDDKEMNDQAVMSGDDRILASYSFPTDAPWVATGGWGTSEEKLWIITEWDRSVTTILFPGEY